MTQSRKLIMTQYGEDFAACTAIVDAEIGEPGPGEVLIRNVYAGVNGVYDLNMVRDAVSYISYTPPTDLGIEVVGRIEKLGPDVSDFAVGDSIATWKVGFGYRDYQVAETSRLYKVPAASPEISCLMPTGISGMVGIEQVGEMTTGETIAISAAAGGLGHIIVQVAKKAGNHVIGICGSDDKAARLTEIGCDRTINYRDEDVDEVLKREYPKGIDIAYDSVGGVIFDAFVNNLAVKGRLVISGYTSEVGKPWEQVTSPRIYQKLYFRSASVRAFINPHFEEFHPDAARRLIGMYQRDEIEVFVDPVEFIGLEDVPGAVEHLLSGKNLGKVVVKLET
ncbi:MAG: zinc-binding dehydrogenase [Rhodospirillaceae bacterium]|jgi:NADPH-dependent curcumin reductase CurA|nr:zinc-binding dehydrogenase [Rhodospirillaceae bacterium]MBT5564293.1 zinc-binding dehydrogenase [Rhodospirillaceae bacterium]MBT6088857.1 zinc-binding dehydrogenase [Rhodospirillaceae bacterium]MBT6960990.1 zinc-binding dehydrogenase [Rhodospirillaceae bacterium]MBT7451799.1 zinc-binding dehydrogenase [Rhodospirillaceae bacterium]